jgi:hypothetical protein
MSPRPLLEAVSVRERVNVPTDNCGSQLDIPALNALALRSRVCFLVEKKKKI